MDSYLDSTADKALDCCACEKNATFQFQKIDGKTGIGLGGAVFQLRSRGETIAVSTSDSKGIVCFSGLCPGRYIMTETAPPAGYLPSERSFMVLVDPCGNITADQQPACDFTVCNFKACDVYGAFTGIKYDLQSQNRLAGAVFGLFYGSDLIQNPTSDASGQFTFNHLPPGCYTLMELEPPPGYELVPTIYQICVSDSGAVSIDGKETDTLFVGNQQSVFTLPFMKTDTEGNPLANAVFTLRSERGALHKAVSDIHGRVLFKNVPEGTYILQEQTPPPGYLPCLTVHTAVIFADGTAMIDQRPAQEFTAQNREAPNIYLLKASTEGTVLEGAVFELRQKDIPVDALITDASGWGAFFRLLPGSYTVVETQAPPGYEPDPQARSVIVSQDGDLTIDGKPTQYITAINTPITANLTGKIMWNDFALALDPGLDNVCRSRPEKIQILLYQNGVLFQRLELPSNASFFTFPDLPQKDPAGKVYLYTIDEETPEGYTKEISGLQITNTLNLVTITANYYDSENNSLLLQDVYAVPYGSDFTLKAPIILGYQLVSDSSYAYHHLTEEQTYTFLYNSSKHGR